MNKSLAVVFFLGIGIFTGILINRYYDPFANFIEGQEVTLDMGTKSKEVRVVNLNGVAGIYGRSEFGSTCRINSIATARVVRTTSQEVLLKLDRILSHSIMSCGRGTLFFLSKRTVSASVKKYESFVEKVKSAEEEKEAEIISLRQRVKTLLDIE